MSAGLGHVQSILYRLHASALGREMGTRRKRGNGAQKGRETENDKESGRGTERESARDRQCVCLGSPRLRVHTRRPTVRVHGHKFLMRMTNHSHVTLVSVQWLNKRCS
jgi:hypothetical protein